MLVEATDPPPLTVTVVPQGDVVGVVLSGYVDGATADQLRSSLTDVIETYRPRSILVDCTDLAFLDAAGISVLIGARQHAGRHHGEIRLLHTCRLVTRVLTLVGSHELFGVPPLA
jgi:anti-sigma B factor antagonist